jgi:hypothetical protein
LKKKFSLNFFSFFHFFEKVFWIEDFIRWPSYVKWNILKIFWRNSLSTRKPLGWLITFFSSHFLFQNKTLRNKGRCLLITKPLRAF